MSEMGEDFKFMKDLSKERHSKWYLQNMSDLMNNDLESLDFEHKDTVCLFRESNKPKVDFYPHTGRWRIVGQPESRKGKTLSGGAKSFLNWYSKQ